MSGKTCARCGKVVYPIEELKCLDKIWHKQCFKCQVCQMTLNMRNYKGFNKEPYCEAHIPKAKATTVAETPEYKRIAENTKIQSNVKYHADFERAKGKFTQVADDPETLRIKENSKNISNVAYHGDLQKKADMEKQRDMSEMREGGSYDGYSGGHQSANSLQQQASSPARNPSLQHTHDHIPSSLHHSRMPSNVIYTSDRGAVNEVDRPVGSIHDLDPVNNLYGSLANGAAGIAGAAEQYSQGKYQPPPQRFYPPPQEPNHTIYSAAPQDHLGMRRDVGSGGGGVGGYASNGRNATTPAKMPAAYQHQQPEPLPSMHQARNSGRVFRAMYEYNAQDTDEVSFLEGDFIVNCTPIDEGWLSGQVQRTGKKGMLPANYVSPAI